MNIFRMSCCINEYGQSYFTGEILQKRGWYKVVDPPLRTWKPWRSFVPPSVWFTPLFRMFTTETKITIHFKYFICMDSSMYRKNSYCYEVVLMDSSRVRNISSVSCGTHVVRVVSLGTSGCGINVPDAAAVRPETPCRRTSILSSHVEKKESVDSSVVDDAPRCWGASRVSTRATPSFRGRHCLVTLEQCSSLGPGRHIMPT